MHLKQASRVMKTASIGACVIIVIKDIIRGYFPPPGLIRTRYGLKINRTAYMPLKIDFREIVSLGLIIKMTAGLVIIYPVCLGERKGTQHGEQSQKDYFFHTISPHFTNRNDFRARIIMKNIFIQFIKLNTKN